MVTRIFLIGSILLFFGLQLRSIDSFVLNEKVSGLINKAETRQVEEVRQVDPVEASLFGYEQPAPAPTPPPAKRRITPPRWLGYSLLSMGAVLVLTCPLYRREAV